MYSKSKNILECHQFKIVVPVGRKGGRNYQELGFIKIAIWNKHDKILTSV